MIRQKVQYSTIKRKPDNIENVDTTLTKRTPAAILKTEGALPADGQPSAYMSTEVAASFGGIGGYFLLCA